MGVMKFFEPGDILEARGKKFLAMKKQNVLADCLECAFYEEECRYIGCVEPNEEVYFVEVENVK